jgi:hypothetical protein
VTATQPTSVDLGPYRGVCSTCRNPIVWAITRDGVKMPVDPYPADNGNVQLAVQARELHAAVLKAGPARRTRTLGIPLHLSHHATCPNADQHRRRRR